MTIVETAICPTLWRNERVVEVGCLCVEVRELESPRLVLDMQSPFRGRRLTNQLVMHVPLPRVYPASADAALDRVECQVEHVPAWATTFSSIIRLPMSLAPNIRAIWPIFSPWVTHEL